MVSCLFFLMWTIFQVFIEFITILFLFYILLILASRHVESQLPNQGLNPSLLHWKAKSQPTDWQGSPSLMYFEVTCWEVMEHTFDQLEMLLRQTRKQCVRQKETEKNYIASSDVQTSIKINDPPTCQNYMKFSSWSWPHELVHSYTHSSCSAFWIITSYWMSVASRWCWG